MFIGLCIFQMILGILVVFTHYMLLHQFQFIEESLERYTNPKAYRTEKLIGVIDTIIKRYAEEVTLKREDKNLQPIIRTSLYTQKIGKFTYIGVKNIALKGRWLMGSTLIIQTIFMYLGEQMKSPFALGLLAFNSILLIGAEVIKCIKGIEAREELLIVVIQDYVLNVYPIKRKENKAKQEVIELRKKVAKLEEIVQENTEEIKNENNRCDEQDAQSQLSEQDIAKLIKLF